MTIKRRLIVGERANEKQGHLDLIFFCYRNAASLNRLEAERRLQLGTLGTFIRSRYEFVCDCHQALEEVWTKSSSMFSVEGYYTALQHYFRFADRRLENPTHSNAERIFLEWRDALRIAERKGDRTAAGNHSYLSKTARVIAKALDVSPYHFAKSAGISKPRGGFPQKPVNLEEARGLISDLVDIIKSLNESVIFGPLPAIIKLTSTSTEYQHYSGRYSDAALKKNRWHRNQYDRRHVAELRQASLENRLRQLRFPLMNLRCSAEFLLFIAATGMNRAQATGLLFTNFQYRSIKGGYRVQCFKERSNSIVEFEIAHRYRNFFDAWLQFRKMHYQDVDSDKLFPILGGAVVSPKFHYQNVRDFLIAADRPWLPPAALRLVKANVVDRLSNDSELEAVILQHSVRTNQTHYRRPHPQQAARELTAYFRTIPLMAAGTASALNGACQANGAPEKRASDKAEAPEPDCANPAGCLFCTFHKGISSPDYIWALLSYKELKSEELASYPSHVDTTASAVRAVILRINEIGEAFQKQSKKQKHWFDAALLRVQNGDYHPRWRGFVTLARLIT